MTTAGEAKPMTNHAQSDDNNKKMMDLLHAYGKEFLVFDLLTALYHGLCIVP